MEDAAALAVLLRKRGNGGYRRYQLKRIDGRLMLVRDELDRMFDLALRDVCGCEIEPDERDRMFSD